MRLRPLPCPITDAKAFVSVVHRKRPKIQGGMWAVAVERPGAPIDPVHAAKIRAALPRDAAEKNVARVIGFVGVAIVARPAPDLDDGHTLNVARVACVEGDEGGGNKGACSMLYGRCARIAKAMDAVLYTYTEIEEPGTSLRAAGWIDEGERAVGIDSRDGRQIDMIPKRRWRAP